MSALRRIPGDGWLCLLGGGEFSFGETLEADAAWLAKTALGTVGFVPAASGSNEYGSHFAEYLSAELDREAETIPIYRLRDSRRGKNLDRLREAAAVYLGGGVPDHLLDAVMDTPAREVLTDVLLREGGVVVAIAAAAQAVAQGVRSIFRGHVLPGFGWLPHGVVDPNFDPAHDRRLRELVGTLGIEWGLGIPAGTAVLLGPDEQVEVVGTAFLLEGEDGDLVPLE
jgi:cyanophycinase-like exopeptidase